MPQSDIFTGLDDTDILNMQRDTQSKLDNLYLPGTLSNPEDITKPEAPKGEFGTVSPGENINLDKNSYEYNAALYNSLIKKTDQQYPGTSHSLPEIDLPQSQTRRYINNDFGFDITRDNEDFYNKQQNAFLELGKSLFARLPLLTVTKLGTGVGYLLGLANPANWMEKNYIAAASDNWFARQFEGLEDKVKNDWLPVYQSAAARNMGFFERMFKDQTFWNNDVVDNAAFMASAAIPGGIASKLGLGTKILAGLGLTQEAALESSSNFLRAMGTAVTKQGVADAALTTAYNTAAMSLYGVKGIRDDLHDKLMNTGKYTESEVNDIIGDKMRNAFLSNLATLTVSEGWFANLMGKAFGKSAIKEGEVGLQKTSLLDDYRAQSKAPTTTIGKALNTPLGFYAKKGLESGLVGGLYMGNVQTAIQRYNENNAEKNEGFFDYVGGVLKQTGSQTLAALTGKDKEAAQSIGIGSLVGGLFGAAFSKLGKQYTFENDQSYAKYAVDALNEARNNWLKVGNIYSVDENGKVKTDTARAASVLLAQAAHTNALDDARLMEDPHQRKIAEKGLFASLVSSHIKNDSFDSLMSQMDDVKTWKNTDQIKLGFDPSSDMASQVNEYKDYANRIKDLYDVIQKIPLQKGQSIGEYEFKKENLFNLGAAKEAVNDELGKVNNDISSLETKIGHSDLTDNLVNQVNGMKLRIAAQEIQKEAADDISKPEEESKFEKYKSQLDKFLKDNQETLDTLRSDKDGYYFYKNEEKREHPLINELHEQIIKKSTIQNASEDLSHEYQKFQNDSQYNKDKYDKVVESFKNNLEQMKKNAEEKKEQPQENNVTDITNEEPKPSDKQPTVEVPKEQEKVLTPEEQVREQVRDLLQKRNDSLKEAKTDEEKKAINDKYISDVNSLYKKGQPAIIEKTPEEQSKNYNDINSKIPESESAHTDVLNSLFKEISDSRKNGNINDEQEGKLLDKVQKIIPVGTFLDKINEGKKPIQSTNNQNSQEEVVDQNTPPTPEDNPQIGKSTDDYNPETENIDDSELENPIFSAIAFRTSNKTVTQEEEEPGKLDEDPYKQFIQNFLRKMSNNPDLRAKYKWGKIIKDSDELPHSSKTENDIKNGTPYGAVLVLTDKDGNVIQFGPNYEESIEQKEGYKPLVYSFNRNVWQESAEQRAAIGNLRTGRSVEDYLKQYAEEGIQQDLARQIVEQGKSVPIEIEFVNPGMIRKGKNLLDTRRVISEEMKPTLYIPPTPKDRFDPEHPLKNKYVLVGNQALINGALYARVDDPISDTSTYVRLLPKTIGQIPEVFEEVKSLLTAEYKDQGNAEQARDYLAKLLFLNKSNRPGIAVNDIEGSENKKIVIVEQGDKKTPEQALRFAELSRYNIIKDQYDNPEKYNRYKAENGKIVEVPQEDYHKFVFDNSQTRELPIKTSDGLKYINLNSYAGFKFSTSLDSMKAELDNGQKRTPINREAPKERSFRKSKDSVYIFRHGEAMDDQNGKTSGLNPTPLTDEGKELAEDLGHRFKNLDIKRIIHSPILRAVQTADIAAMVADISDVKVNKDLRTWDIGDYAAGPRSEFDEQWFINHPDQLEHDGKKVGESFNTFVNRMIKVYNELKDSPEDTAIVAHSRNIRVWDAYKMNGEVWNDEAVEKYLNIPSEHSFTTFTRSDKETKDNSSLTKSPFKRFKTVETNTEESAKESEDKGKDIEKGLFSKKQEGKPSLTEGEIEKVNSIFGKEVAKKINGIATSDASAMWTASGIKLFKDAKEGDGYHEAWHHFTQMYLDDGQKRALYGELRKKAINFETRDGKNLNTKTASDFDIEEFLADDFRDYVLNDGKSRIADRPYRNTIFRKILDFIKQFFFGSVNVPKLYDELYNGRLNKYEPSVNNAWWGKLNSLALNHRGEEILGNDKAPYYRGIVDYLLGQQILKRRTSLDAMRRSRNLTQGLYEDVYNDLVTNYYNPLIDNAEAGKPYNEEVLNDLDKVLSNWQDFVEYHKNTTKLFVNIPHSIFQNVPENAQDYTDSTDLGGENYTISEDLDSARDDMEEEGEDSLLPQWEKHGNEMSSFQSSSPETRALIRMLPEVKLVDGIPQITIDSNGFPKLNDYSKTWNNIVINLGDISSYDEMIEKMKDPEVISKVPELTELIKHLPDPAKEHSKDEMDQIIRFRSDFNKSYVGIYSGRMMPDGKFFFNEETKRNQDAVKRLWTANFYNKTSSDPEVADGRIIVDEETGKNYINPAIKLNYSINSPLGREQLLNLLGIKFSDDLKKTRFYVDNLSQYLKDTQDNINSRLDYGQKIYNPVQDLRRDLYGDNKEVAIQGIAGIIDTLTFAESKFSNELPTMSYQTAEGNMIYAMSENNGLTINRNKLNRATHYNDILNDPSTQQFNFDNNPYVRHSLFLNALFNFDTSDPNKYGKRTSNNIVVGNYNGLKSTDNDGNQIGYSTTSLNTRQKVIFDMESLLSKGAVEIPRTEVSKSAYFVKLQNYNIDKIDPTRAYLPVGVSEFSSGFSSPGLKRIMFNQLYDELYRMQNADNVPIFKKAGNESLLESQKEYHLFRNILTEEGKDQERLKNDIKSDLSKLSVDKVLEKYGNRIDKSIENFFNGELKSFKETLQQENIPVSKIGSSIKGSDDQKIRAFLANDFILNVEYTKLFDGDTSYQAHYKDYFKRSKGVSSTGKTPITDDSFARYMKNGEKYTFSGFIGSKIDNDYKTTRTVNFKDDKRPSKYIDIWKQNLKTTDPKLTDTEINKIVDKYKDMNIGDGQGHITLDFYRQFLKSIDNWGDDQEKMYQIELAKWRLENADFNHKYSNEEKANDRDLLRRNGDITFSYFPPIKMQYHGPIKAEGTYAQVMDKFSVAPLIPSIIKGTPLEDVNIQMLKNGIGYSKFESGTKKYKDPPISLYGENGYKGLDLTNHDAAVHYLDYLKEQISTNPKIKEESIFGSQVRKLIEANIFSKGVGDKVDLERHERYKAILQNMKDIAKKDLLDQLSVQEKDGKYSINDVRKFVSTLQEQADLRDLNNEIKSYISFDKDTNKLLYPLETSLNRKSIQDLIMGLIDTKLRRQNVNGDMAIQISSSGFQPNDFKYTNSTEDDIKKYGTNGLRYYHLGDDGKTVASQVKVGLNGGFERLLFRDHPDGKKIGTVDRLNELLKDDNWMKENRHLVTLIGYRIPTQGHNSMEFMEVAEFLPSHFSGIIVPAEIVAKSGSDFDIDKLNIFRPSFDEKGNYVEDESKEGNSNKLIQLYKEILSDPKNFKSLITPNDTSLIKPDIDQISVALGRRTQKDVEDGKPYSGTQIFRYKNNLRKFESLLSASKLLGIFAVNNTFSQLMQQEGITTNVAYGVTNGPIRQIKLFLMSPKERESVIKNGRIDLSNKYDVTGRLKQDNFSQLINATVDAPTDDFLGYNSISYENAGVLSYLINQGNPFDRVQWFLHQPVLMKYYSDLRGKNPSDSKSFVQARLLSKFTGNDYFFTDENTGKIRLDRTIFNKDINSILNNPKYQQIFLSKENLKNQVKRIRDVDAYLDNPRTKEYNALILSYFLSLREQAGLFRNFQSLLNFDTRKTTSPLSAYQAWKGIDQLKANKMFSVDDYSKIANKSIVSSFDNRRLIAIIGNTMMPAAFSPSFLSKISPIVTKNTDFKPSSFKDKYIRNIESQWIEYMVKSLGKIDNYSLSSYNKFLTEGKGNIARRFNDLMGKYPELKDNYNLVSRIRANFSNRPDIKKSNLEIQRLFDNTTDDQNRYAAEFRSLINFDDPKYTPAEQKEIQSFFKDMAIAGFVQSGFSKSNISFQEIIPHEVLADTFKTAIKNYRKFIESDKVLNDKYISEFLNQFKNNNIQARQPWRGKDYFLASPFADAIKAKFGEQEQKKYQVNTKPDPAPYENVKKQSDEVKDVAIPFQPANIKKILEGKKTSTTRSAAQVIAIGLQPGETGRIQIGNKSFLVKYKGFMSAADAGGKEAILKSEGVLSSDDFNYQQTKDWINGKGKLGVYSIEPEIDYKPEPQPEVKTERQYIPGEENRGKIGKAEYKYILDRLDSMKSNKLQYSFLDMPDGLNYDEAVDILENPTSQLIKPITRDSFERMLSVREQYGDEILNDLDKGELSFKSLIDDLKTVNVNNDNVSLEFRHLEGLLKEWKNNSIEDEFKDEAESILSKYGLLDNENQLSLFDRDYTDTDMDGDPIGNRIENASDDELKESLDNC